MLKETLMNALMQSADILTGYFSKKFSISHKEGINNLVTEVDHKSEEKIIEVIKSAFPDHAILSEECGALSENSDYKWIIDPIDGTVNFAHGIPICCISIGIEKNGKMIMGGVYNPFMNELYFAELNKGAYLNDVKITVSKTEHVLNSCIVTGFPYTYLDSENGPVQVVERFIRKGIPIRRLGSAALDLCWVAAGRFDAFYEHALNPWDSAAGFLIVQEAGGTVTDMKNNLYNPYQPGIIASNSILHEELFKWIKGDI